MAEYEIEGLDELARKLDGNALLGEPFRQAMQRGVLLLDAAAKEYAPVDTGNLRRSVVSGLDPAIIPLWGEVGTNVPYARPLDQPLTREPHHRRGAREGELTAGWLTGGLERMRDRLDALFAAAMREIEERWGR